MTDVMTIIDNYYTTGKTSKSDVIQLLEVLRKEDNAPPLLDNFVDIIEQIKPGSLSIEDMQSMKRKYITELLPYYNQDTDLKYILDFIVLMLSLYEQ